MFVQLVGLVDGVGVEGYFEHRVVDDERLNLLLLLGRPFLRNQLSLEMHGLEEVTIREHFCRSDVEVEISLMSGRVEWHLRFLTFTFDELFFVVGVHKFISFCIVQHFVRFVIGLRPPEDVLKSVFGSPPLYVKSLLLGCPLFRSSRLCVR